MFVPREQEVAHWCLAIWVGCECFCGVSAHTSYLVERAVQVDAAVRVAPGAAGVDLSRLEIKAGNILFLVPVDGKILPPGGRRAAGD